MAELKSKWKWNMAGFKEARTRPATVSAVGELSSSVSSRAGDGYVKVGPEISRGKGRARAAVLATGKAARNEAKNHTLAGMASGKRA